jgi:RNA polymerase sigma factor (sigma-70 family)
VGPQDKLWQELFSHEAEVFAFVKDAVGDADIARDLFQDIYLSALKNLAQLDPARSLKNWLYTTARNRVINYFRYHRRRDYTEFDEQLMQIRDTEKSDKELISSVLNGMPEKQKKALLLHEVDGLSYQELSGHFGLTVTAVTGLLSRARDNFRKQYLLHFLPQWLTASARQIELSDLFRFMNPFNPPLDVAETIDRNRSRYFASITAEWDKIREDFLDNSDLDLVFKNTGIREGQLAADMGCGTGFVTIPLALIGLNVLALDADAGMLARLRATRLELNLINVNMVCTDLRLLPVSSRMFDHIFFVLVLHHLPDPFTVLDKCIKMLKKNGQLIIVDFLRHREQALADQMHDLWLGFNPQALKKRLQKQGMQLKHAGHFLENKKIPSFFQIWSKV